MNNCLSIIGSCRNHGHYNQAARFLIWKLWIALMYLHPSSHHLFTLVLSKWFCLISKQFQAMIISYEMNIRFGLHENTSLALGGFPCSGNMWFVCLNSDSWYNRINLSQLAHFHLAYMWYLFWNPGITIPKFCINPSELSLRLQEPSHAGLAFLYLLSLLDWVY
jgi:hypothetical protein